jgi:copper chaperone CopZ
VDTITKTVSALRGVKEVDVGFEESRATVTYVEGAVDPMNIAAAIESKGYEVTSP